MTTSRFNLRIHAVTILVSAGLLLAACGGTPSATTATVQPLITTVVPSPQPTATEPSSGFTAGTYTSIVTEADVSTKPDLAANVGSWRVRFSGKDAASGSFDVMVDGENIASGAYTLKGDQIILTDNSEPCTGLGAGTYRWSSDGKQLTLLAITDPCEDRKFVFTVRPLTMQPSQASADQPTAAPVTTQPATQQPLVEPKPYIPVISRGFPFISFWQLVKQGTEKAAKEFNVDTTFDGPGTDEAAAQLKMLQAAIDKKPAAICLAAVDSKAAIPLLEKARAANIPVIGFDSGVDSDIPAATVATDNIAAAAAAADKMAQLIGGSGEVAIVAHDQTSRTGIDRVKGFTEQINKKYPNIKIIDTQYGSDAFGLATDIILAHPNLKGLFATNEGAIMGVLDAAQAQKIGGKVVIIGYDAGSQQKDAIRSGLEAGAITQDPINMGYKCIEAAVKAMKGEKLDKNIDTGFKWYDRTNMDDPAIAPLLYD